MRCQTCGGGAGGLYVLDGGRRVCLSCLRSARGFTAPNDSASARRAFLDYLLVAEPGHPVLTQLDAIRRQRESI